MIRVAISVEGETEEEFVKEILYPHLYPRNIWVTPINMQGNISVDRAVPDLSKLYHSYDRITTFYDFYGFKHNYSIDGNALEQVILEKVKNSVSSSSAWDERKFMPYIQMHEFEALLFTDVTSFNILPIDTEKGIQILLEVRKSFPTPEDINNSPQTAPSKRILRVFPAYDKVEYGALVILEIKLDRIRLECPRFDNWVTWLENLAS